MAVVVRYNPQGLTAEKAEAISQTIMEKGQAMGMDGPPEDLMVHVRFGDGADMMISEIWTSEAAWRQAYDNLLKPVLEEAGVETAPDVFEAHNVWGSGVPAPPSAQPA